jgi:PKD repeat protein
MDRSRSLLLALALFVSTACNSTNPVAPPPPDNPGGGGTASVTVTLSSNVSRLSAGSTQGATLTVTAKTKDGSPATDPSVSLTTNLGNFGTDTSGKALQLITAPLAGGSATVSFFPGKDKGTANIVAQVGTANTKLNLPIDDPLAAPVADFTFEVSGLSVLFTDASTGSPTAWSWSFGDNKSSTAQSPMHTFPEAGSYTVSLTVTAAGGQSTKSKFVTVQAGDPLIANFDFAADGLSVLFTDKSAGTPTGWFWDFGDGKSSTAKSPSHVYSQAGTYTVELTIVNAFGVRDSTSKFVALSLGDPPVADFDAQTAGLKVLFTDASTGKPTSWSWDFGDGAGSTAQNPTHTYSQAGSFTVTLRASNAGGSSTKSKVVTVSLGDPPKAAFDAQVNGFNVVFTDQSTGKPTSWVWDFGDGAGSTAQNPSYTYARAGTYTVSLTASNVAGLSRATKLVTIASSSPPVADFCFKRNGLTVIFTDGSAQSPTSWSWDFGDCASQASTCKSTAQNPGHSYVQAGTYAVSLTVANAAGQSTRSKFVQVDELTVDSFPMCP